MLLQVSEISKQYPAGVAGLLPMSFTLSKSECLAVIGESGSGKTTLLQILAGYLPTDGGKMLLKKKLLPLPTEMLVRGYPDIQLVPQDFRLLPNHRVWENITYPIRNYPAHNLEKRLAYLAELLDLKDLLTRYPRELSGGQQQRTAIARALANEPAILLLDEPFNQADGQTKQKIAQALAYLKNTSKTAIILVTHEPQEALGLADKMLVLQAGKVLQYDTPQNIYEKPTNFYTSTLLGLVNELLHQKAVRAEHCHISLEKKGIKATLLHSFYEGYRYKYLFDVGAGKAWVVYSPFFLEPKHTEYYIVWEASKLLDFS